MLPQTEAFPRQDPDHDTNQNKTRFRSGDRCLDLRESQVVLGIYDANGIRVSQTTAPALHTHHLVTLLQDTELDRLGDTPLQAAVNIHLPAGGFEIGLLLGEKERVYATVQVRVLLLSARA